MSVIEQSAPAKYPDVRNYIGGSFVDSDGHDHLDVTNPANGSVISRVPLSGMNEVERAVDAAKNAQPAWAATPIKERVQVFYRYKALLEKHIDELATLVTEENGKIRNEAEAEVLKSAELCEFACSLPQIIPGEVLEVSRGVECRVERYPVGIVASITPFNFPNMVPNWTIPNAIALGNAMILKPSEQVPISSGRIADCSPRPDCRTASSTSCTADSRASRRFAIIRRSNRSASSDRRTSRRSSIAAAPRISSASSPSAVRRIT